MRLVTALFLALLGLSTLACSGVPGANDPLAYVPEAKLTEPWTKMNLPIGDGKVSNSDNKMMTVMYSGEDVPGKIAAYGASIEKAGFSKESEPSTDPTVHSVIWDKGGKKLTETVTASAGITTVTLAKTE